MQRGKSRRDWPVKVVVVAADAARLEQYEAALRAVGTPTLATVDADEAEALLSKHHPIVVVLDDGLPRLVRFRLYGLVREDEGAPPVQVVFVGQDGEAGPGDHYVPGECSPSFVADQVASLVAAVTVADSASAGSASSLVAPTGAAEPAVQDQAQVDEDAASPSGSGPSTQVETRLGEDVVPSGREGPESLANGQADGAVVSAPVRQEGPDASAPSVTDEVAGASPGAPAAPAEAPVGRPGRRLDVILVRVGLVLLVLGGLLILLQVQASQAPLVAPTVVPAAPTRRPAASPSPSPSARYDVPTLSRRTDLNAG